MNDDFCRKSNPIATAFWLIVLIVGMVFFIYTLVQAIIREENNKRTYKAHYTEQEQKYIKVFTKYGSPDPHIMACAVTKTKRPALMAALAIRESNGNPHAVGDGKQSLGAFQVQPKHWQPVPSTATEQAQQAERILDELVAVSPRGSLLQALSRYNSGKPASRAGRRYAARVLGLTKKIERG